MKVVNISDIPVKKKKKLVKKKKKPKNFINDYINNIENTRKVISPPEENTIKTNEVLLFSDAEDD